MLKKLNRYILRLFIGPFLTIFSLLFFIFIIVFFWSIIDKILGKGVDLIIITKVIFYYGCSMIPLIIPVSLLVTSIIVYGSLGEHYELAAIKSTGISLWKAIRGVFFIVLLISVSMYLYSDYLSPICQKKVASIFRNILTTQPGLRINEGAFTDTIPNFTMKIDKKVGNKNQAFEGIFILSHLNKSVIIAKKGSLAPSTNPNFLKLKLFKGFLYRENSPDDQEKTSYDKVNFDVLTQYFDISSLVNRNLEEESLTDRPDMFNTIKLIEKVDLIKKENIDNFDFIEKKIYKKYFKKEDPSIFKDKQLPLYTLKGLKDKERKKIIKRAQRLLTSVKKSIEAEQERIIDLKKHLASYQFELHKKFSLSITCILLFIIGSSLGAFIRKGGLGLPALVALIIFISYHVLSLVCQNLAQKTIIPAWLGAWTANMIMFPIGILILYRSFKK